MNLRLISITIFFVIFSGALSGQIYYQKLTGVVIDSESHKPLYSANILIETISKINGVSADSSGRFNLLLPPGRHTIKISYLGYNTRTIKDNLVGSGKETNITVELTESFIEWTGRLRRSLFDDHYKCTFGIRFFYRGFPCRIRQCLYGSYGFKFKKW